MTRLVQIRKDAVRRIGVVEEPHLRLLAAFPTVYALAQAAVSRQTGLTSLLREHVTDEVLAYDPIYEGASEWRLLPPIDHPEEPARCLVSGTGLTHLGSAKNRDAMHEVPASERTDSMKMFRWGIEAGRPGAGMIGVAPEWFYKGNATMLRAHGEPLVVPAYGEDGGEEGEIAGVYMVGPDGETYRIGMSIGNEFSDHVFERKNYLNLAGSKLRTCSLGPELAIDPAFQSVPGRVQIVRRGQVLWSKAILTGEAEMCHSLRNIEHHHFKFAVHRRPGDVHVHYYGACDLSFGAGIRLEDGDVMTVHFDGFGRPLSNTLQVDKQPDIHYTAQPLI